MAEDGDVIGNIHYLSINFLDVPVTVYAVRIPLANIRVGATQKFNHIEVSRLIRNNNQFIAVLPANNNFTFNALDDLTVVLIKRADDNNDVFADMPEVTHRHLKSHIRVLLVNACTGDISFKKRRATSWCTSTLEARSYGGIVIAREVSILTVADAVDLDADDAIAAEDEHAPLNALELPLPGVAPADPFNVENIRAQITQMPEAERANALAEIAEMLRVLQIA